MRSRAAEHRLDELDQVIPQHGCFPAEPASVSPGEVILPSLRKRANSDGGACSRRSCRCRRGLFQLAIAGSMDLSLTSGEHILLGHLTDRAMQAHGVVVIHVALNQAPGILQGQRCQWPDTLACKRFVPAFELSIRLWVKRRGPHVRHTGDPNELLEVACYELRSVVRDDPRFRFRVVLFRPFANDFDVGFPHRFPQIPMHEETTVSLQHAAQVVERAGHVDVGNIDVPVLMRLRRLLEAGPLA